EIGGSDQIDLRLFDVCHVSGPFLFFVPLL
ncbi:MAG: hypothetical protein ACI9IV_002235, partial [Paracoccaceae bacterium]